MYTVHVHDDESQPVMVSHTNHTPQVLLGFKDKRPVAKVADFGLSKSRHTTFLTNMSSQRGTLPWIAPEILRTPDTVTEKADVFSFGVRCWLQGGQFHLQCPH